MKSWQQKILYSNYLPNTDKEILNKLLYFNIIIAVYIFVAVSFVIIHMIRENYLIATILFGGAVIVVGIRILVDITKKHQIAFIMLAILSILLLLMSFITGGINNSGPLWYFAFPMAILILLGPLKGAIASLSLIVISYLLLLHPFSQIMMTSYKPDFLMLHFISYSIVFIFSFSYEFQKQKTKKELKELKGLLPICSSCKKIRDDNGYWNQIEKYIYDHSEANFTHSICPECAKKLYPDLYI